MPTQRVVLITGASSGIGRATANLLARQGFRVFGTSKPPDETHANGFTMLPLDIRSSESIQTCVQMVMEQAGRLDVLVNNAGCVGPAAASEEVSLAQIRSLFETNFFGGVHMINTVLPIMRYQREGQIINISSLAGLVATPPFYSFYAASKHALEGYTEALRYEVKPFNIRVSLVEPGYFKTNLYQTIQQPDKPLSIYTDLRQRLKEIGRVGIQYGRDPVLVAQAILRIVHSQSPRLRYQVGLDAVTMARAKRFLPYAAVEWMMRWLFLEGNWKTNDASDDMLTLSQFGMRRFFLVSRPRFWLAKILSLSRPAA